jgi:hypothetical protein
MIQSRKKLTSEYTKENYLPENFNEDDVDFSIFKLLDKELIPVVELVELKDVYVDDESLVYDSQYNFVEKVFEYAIVEKFYRNRSGIINKARMAAKRLVNITKKRKEFDCNKNFLLITDDRCINNFFHWMVDSLGRIMVLRECYNISDFVFLLNERTVSNKYTIDSLKKIGVKECNIEIIPYNSKSFMPKLFTITTTITATGTCNPMAVRKVRDYFIDTSAKHHTGNDKIYISRGKFKDRKIYNEVDFVYMIKQLGFLVVYPEDHSFKEMVSILSTAKVLIGIHGTALTNMLFMMPKSKIICLKHKDGYPLVPDYWGDNYDSVVSDHYFFSMANCLNFKFYHCACEPANGQDKLPFPDSDLYVDINHCRSLIKTIE